jgi:hypothetical protein
MADNGMAAERSGAYKILVVYFAGQHLLAGLRVAG